MEFEGYVKLPNKFYIGGCIDDKLIFPINGMKKLVHTIVDAKDFQGRVVDSTWDDWQFADHIIMCPLLFVFKCEVPTEFGLSG